MVECISVEGRRWITGELVKLFGRGINFQWGISEIDELYSGVESLAPESIFLEMETKPYKCGNGDGSNHE